MRNLLFSNFGQKQISGFARNDTDWGLLKPTSNLYYLSFRGAGATRNLLFSNLWSKADFSLRSK